MSRLAEGGQGPLVTRRRRASMAWVCRELGDERRVSTDWLYSVGMELVERRVWR